MHHKEDLIGNPRLDKEKWLCRVFKEYPDRVTRFEYTKVHDFSNIAEDITVTCKKHGDFTTTPRNHLKSKNGCYKCYRTTPEDFLEMVSKKGFSNLSYPNLEKELSGKSKSKIITVLCSEHGSFKKNMSKVLSSKHGCMGCFHNSLLKSVEDFKEKFLEIHSETLTCDFSQYKSVTSPITVYCKHHGEFKISPHRLISHKQGCKKCGYKRCSVYTITQAERNKCDFLNTPSGLYVLRLSDSTGISNYKLGISKDINSRLHAIRRDSELEVEELFYREVNLYAAINIEQDTFDLLHNHLINDDIRFSGYTERFYLGDEALSDFIEYLDYQITGYANMENAP